MKAAASSSSARTLRIAAFAIVAALLAIAFDAPAGDAGSTPRVLLTAPAEARAAPPGGPLNAVVGKKLQSLPAGTEVEVLEARRYGGFEGSNVWLKVKSPPNGASAPARTPVWIYGGVQPAGKVVPSGVAASQ